MIRRAKCEDIPQIIDLLNQVLYVHHSGRPDIFKEKGSKYTEAELRESLTDDNNPVWVYEDSDGTILAHCFCQIIDHPEAPHMYAYKTLFIDDLCVSEKSRGKHIGRELYEFVKAYARDNDFYNVTLHAWTCNPNACEFYKHIGMDIQQYTMEEILKEK